MLLSVFVMSAAGILLGLRYRASALLAATALVIVGSVVCNLLGSEVQLSGVSTLVLVLTLQGAYLGGLWLAFIIRRIARTNR